MKRKVKRWKAFSKRERALIAFSLTSGMMTGATFAQERADSGELSEEDKRKEAATMLTMTKLMDQITRSMGGDGIDPALKLMLTAVANPSENVTVRVVPIETVPDDIARM